MTLYFKHFDDIILLFYVIVILGCYTDSDSIIPYAIRLVQ